MGCLSHFPPNFGQTKSKVFNLIKAISPGTKAISSTIFQTREQELSFGIKINLLMLGVPTGTTIFSIFYNLFKFKEGNFQTSSLYHIIKEGQSAKTKQI